MRLASLAAVAGLGLASMLQPSALAQSTGSSVPGERQFTLYNGSQVTLGPDGVGVITDAQGRNPRPFTTVLPQGQSALGDQPGPSDAALIRQLSIPQRRGSPSDVVVALSSATFDGQPVNGHAVTAHTTDPRINAALHALGATTARPLFGAIPSANLTALSHSARSHLGPQSVALNSVYVVHVTGVSAMQASQTLQVTPGVSYAEPDEYVSTMDTNPVALPGWAQSVAARPAAPPASSPGLPTNFGLTSSLQSYLNANGVDLMGAYSDIENRFNQLPGTGEVITNVSLGDLTDQSMADAGDSYVRYFGPTTVVSNGQRYLDYPSLPLIPTYTVSPDGTVNPLGTVEGVDPYLGEVLLDFSVMAPLPDGQQRSDAPGSGLTDLLGIAPGATYRLVEPQEPTFGNIAAAMLAAAQQTPRPDVITASLGFGTDVEGFPGRYLEDDPLMNSVVSAIVQQGIVVTISSNDGTRLYTPAPVGPDGGSTPTNAQTPGQAATSVGDDATSTTPSVVPDSGAIAVGGTTLDDTIGVPPQDGGSLAHTGTFAETRLNGATSFSSGFGTRVNVSAPSDNIAALMHSCLSFGNCQPTDAVTVLDGGTSASAPMTAAVVADCLQVAKAMNHPLTPDGVRTLLAQTGRPVPTQPQIDQQLHVGPQIDLTAAVRSLLKAHSGPPAIVRLSVAHRVAIGDAGATFVEITDPSNIDLEGPQNILGQNTGEGLAGPITFGIDATDLPDSGPVSYSLVINGHVFTSSTPAIRLTPTEILTAAGLPVISSSSRTVSVMARVLVGQGVIASTSQSLTFGPSDGVLVMAPAPVAPAVVQAGSDVQVQYDLTNVSGVSNPQLIVSSINHWSPFSAPLYRINDSVPLPSTSGTVTVPASAFSAGGGIYGLAIEQNPQARTVGAVVAIRIAGASDARPPAPTFATSGGSFGHTLSVTRANPTFQVSWDAGSVPGATGASLEVSAPGPTIYHLLNTFTNQNGTVRDNNGGDTGSVALIPLSGVSGTATLDASKLGIASSLHYTARILATSGGQVIGQASPVSSLEYDDGIAPNGATVTGFDIKPNGASTVSTASVGSDGNPTGSDLYTYSPATGLYGPSYADDTSGQYVYAVLGSDPSDNHMIAESQPWYATDQHILTYDTTDRHLVGDTVVDQFADYWFLGGRVDPQRHRLVMLGWRSDGVDTLVPFDTTTGQEGSPVLINGTFSRRSYRYLDIDGSTGNVAVAASFVGDLCILRNANYTTVNLDTGQSLPATHPGRCVTGIASDQNGHAEVTVGPLFGFPNLYPRGRWQQVDESSGSVGPIASLGADAPLFPTVDPVHGLLVVGFLASPDYLTNNNGMSGVGVYDLHTGQELSYMPDFNLFPAIYGFAGNAVLSQITSQGIQLDPATRTGWTYGPDGTQVQQFSY